MCVCVCVCVCVYSFAHSCPTFCNPWTIAHQASLSLEFSRQKILEWVAISSSRGSSQPRDGTCVSCISCIGRQILYHSAIWEALERETGQPIRVSRMDTVQGPCQGHFLTAPFLLPPGGSVILRPYILSKPKVQTFPFSHSRDGKAREQEDLPKST